MEMKGPKMSQSI